MNVHATWPSPSPRLACQGWGHGLRLLALLWTWLVIHSPSSSLLPPGDGAWVQTRCELAVLKDFPGKTALSAPHHHFFPMEVMIIVIHSSQVHDHMLWAFYISSQLILITALWTSEIVGSILQMWTLRLRVTVISPALRLWSHSAITYCLLPVWAVSTKAHFLLHYPPGEMVLFSNMGVTIVKKQFIGATTLENHLSVSTKVLNLHTLAHSCSPLSAIEKHSTKAHQEPRPRIWDKTSQWWKFGNNVNVHQLWNDKQHRNQTTKACIHNRKF